MAHRLLFADGPTGPDRNFCLPVNALMFLKDKSTGGPNIFPHVTRAVMSTFESQETPAPSSLVETHPVGFNQISSFNLTYTTLIIELLSKLIIPMNSRSSNF